MKRRRCCCRAELAGTPTLKDTPPPPFVSQVSAFPVVSSANTRISLFQSAVSHKTAEGAAASGSLPFLRWKSLRC